MSTLSIEETRKKLLNIIRERGLYIDNEQGFILSSKKKSNLYFDIKSISLEPKSSFFMATLLYEIIKEEGDEIAIGGLELGAVPIVISLTSYSFMQHKREFMPFIIRKQPKKYGLNRFIEGKLKENQTAILIEDVITTGKSTIYAIEKALAFPLKIRKVICIVDREEGGIENIKQQYKDIDIISLYKSSEILKAKR
jgi:orotate phosphoribosyltransferase